MSLKRTLILASSATALILAVSAFLVFRPRQYYRFQGGRVYLVTDPNMAWNSLRPAPCLEFEVPIIARATTWKPTPQQVRDAIAQEGNLRLSEEEITRIVQSCVSYDEWTKAFKQNRPVDGSPPIR